MNYTTTIEINKPLDTVIQLFDNQQNYFHWMAGLKRYEITEGIFGQEGAKADLEFVMGKRTLRMKEVVLKRNYPHEYAVQYEVNGVKNLVRNKFEPAAGGRTRYLSENEFEFKGILVLMGWLMPGSFRKQSVKYQADFKTFAENSSS